MILKINGLITKNKRIMFNEEFKCDLIDFRGDMKISF